MTHLQFRIDGRSPGGEVWSTSLRYAGVADLGQQFEDGSLNLGIFTTELLQEIADGALGVIADLPLAGAMREGMSSSLNIAGVKLLVMDDAGETVNAAEALFSSPLVGSGNITKPLQTSVVVTLNFGAVYGRSGRGRLYWPFLGTTADMSGPYIAAPWREELLTEFNQFQQNLGSVINDAAAQVPTVKLVVFSPTLGQVRRVDNLSIDNVPDTQRRRRDRLPSTRLMQAKL